MSVQIDPSLFRTRLAETIAWCSPRASAVNPRDCLRTPALLAPAFLRGPEPRLPYEPAAVEAMVCAVVETRSALLLAEGALPGLTASSLHGGRLMAYDPESNLADGFAEMESAGFVDVDNAPPWDTWICYVRERDPSESWHSFDRYIVSWVPAQLLHRAERVIWVNPEDCILWLEDLGTPISRDLQNWFSLIAIPDGGDVG